VNQYASELQRPLQMKFLTKLTFACLFAYVPVASAQQITGRFYPEKHQYLVGEPIIVVFEIVNNSAKAAEIGESYCPWLNPHQFEVANAPSKRKIELYGCGEKVTGGSCLGSSREIPAGGEYQKRLLVEGDFEVDSPGRYHIRAKREQTIHTKEGNDLGIDLKVDSEFDVDIRAPNAAELAATYQPLLDDLHSRDTMVRSLAASAVTQHPPDFAEAAILALADDPVIPAASIEGLKRLATPLSRAKLLQMASASSPEYLRQPAIEALGEVGNAEDCEAMLKVASENMNYTQAEAYIVAGRICKERALPTLNDLLAADGWQLLMGVAGGLANTSSRSAVVPLISLLQSSDGNIRRAATDALATLTHRKSKYGIGDEDSAKESFSEWLDWWSIDGGTAPIYSSDQCTEPQLLP
jgi:hypothetical protein